MKSSFQKRDLGTHTERAACLCGRVWAFAQGGLVVKPAEERSDVFVRSRLDAEYRKLE